MMTAPWSEQRKLEALWRGPHKSAKEAAEFVRGEFCDFVKKNFWTVLPYSAIKHLRNLRLSPLGAVPQRGRRPRLIVDLSFYGINQETLPIAPSEAMQFGRALQRILQRILMADPRFGPLYLAKVDIADGFYRIALAPRDCPQLAVLLPKVEGEEPMVAIPLVLPMGWVSSPPYFSAVTETAADVMNRRLHRAAHEPPHRLEALAIHPTEESPEPQHRDTVTTELPTTAIHKPRYHRPIRYAEIYVDDFIGLIQGNRQDRLHAMRAILHVLDDVLRPVEPGDNPHRQEPASVKKLMKGDANWSTSKVILGWLIDTVQKTIQLPQHRHERLREILSSIKPTQRRTTAKQWHRLLGELRSMSIGVPGARGLFSTLQTAFATAADPLSHDGNRRLKLNAPIHKFLDDFRTLAEELPARPTRIAELIPQSPTVLGATDASGFGLGGVAFISTTQGVEPVLWREEVPEPIQRKLVSFENPTGTVTNSDLELAASVVHHDVLTTTADLREHTVHTFHDNTPTKYWQRKGSTTTLGPAASLLRIQSFHQRFYRYVPFHDFLAGTLNRMDKVLAAAPPEEEMAFRRDLRAGQEAVRRGVVQGTQKRADAHWKLWLEFCSKLNIDPLLQYDDPIPYLQVFAVRYRKRPGKDPKYPVRSGTVKDAVRSVGQTMASMGARDVRKDAAGDIDFRLARQFRFYSRQDPPPHRVKPIPISLIRTIAENSRDGNEAEQAEADMIILAFFFLLRPGEYTGTPNDDTPFELQDIQLFVHGRPLNNLTSPVAELLQATAVSFTFTTQKNGVRGEVVNHGASGHDLLCPVRAAARRILHLRSHNAHPRSILATYFQNGRLRQVKAKDITARLRAVAAIMGPAYNYKPSDVSARSLRAGGAMALFNSDVDSDTIRLIGRWQSDAMLRYLHLQAQPVMQGFARRMLQGGDYAFHQAAPTLVPMY